MIFRRIIYTAIFVGCLAGLMLSAAQIIMVNPIIFAAETFELAESAADSGGHSHSGHDHGDAWSSEDGKERTSFTIFANIAAGIGFAAILLSLMSQLQIQGLTQLSLLKGALWGLAGYIAVFVAPAIGLPPEIPGIEAAALKERQLWWILAVIAVGAGLLVISFAPLKYKVIGIILAFIPYIVNIPHHEGPAFAHPDPEAVATLTALHQQFIIASAASNLVFWLVLGVIAAWGLNRWVLKGITFNSGSSHAAV